jgi:hypothetical protein
LAISETSSTCFVTKEHSSISGYGDFQGFSKESVNNSEITDLVNILKGFENSDKENFEEWLQSQTFESGFL